jgi:hypothetical protein
VVDESWDEKVWMEVNAFEATLVMQDLGEGVDWPCVCTVAGDKGLDNQSRTNEVEWGEDEPCYEVGCNGE